jgi:hypothetical protein
MPMNAEAEQGLLTLKELVEGNSPAFATFRVHYRNRTPDINHPRWINKIDALLDTADYDEIWFFGKNQIKTEIFSVLAGGARNELEEDEISALKTWMNTGGVLMTGDHSETNPSLIGEESGIATDPDTFIGFGKALGAKVPRAGKMRKWSGTPTSDASFSFNTQVPVGTTDLENPSLQTDPLPQSIEVVKFPPQNLCHPILRTREGELNVFPDHMHEGALVEPDQTDPEEWPPSTVAGPFFIAFGTDKRPGRAACKPLLSVYDGDTVNRGRIVADSTWHHYLNINLAGFAGDTLASLGQYYGNLALWLAPLQKRKQMTSAMFWWLATHPSIHDENSRGEIRINEIATNLLSQHTLPCEVSELLSTMNPSVFPESADFLEHGSSVADISSEKPILGKITKDYHQSIIKLAVGQVSPHELRNDQFRERLMATGLKSALSVDK